MQLEIEIFVQLLKDEIQRKFGKRILYSTDCQVLSEQIKHAAQRQISVSTIKRFFGIIKTSFDPSKYTLDTLAIYLEFDNWQEFIKKFEKEKTGSPQHETLISTSSPKEMIISEDSTDRSGQAMRLVKNNLVSHETWDTIKQRNKILTDKSLRSLKNKIKTGLEKFPLRRFAENRFKEFLSSTSIATAFIAPEGYGKSTIIAQLTEKFFTGVDAKYPNDIVCLVDGSILFNLLSFSQELNRLYNLLEYNPVKGFGVVFRNHPELVKGRYVLIIDGIDDIYSENWKLNHFIDNLLNMISSYENIGWFKLLITCSPGKWRMFSYRMQKNQMLKSLWFDVTFQGTDDEIINIPLLKRKEIKTILEINHFSQNTDDLCFNNPDILDIINNPYMLYLFLLTYNQGGIIRDIDLLNQYIINTVLSPPYEEEKFFIIKLFFSLSDYGRKSIEVRKEDLNLASSSIIAYNELIRNGILYEYTVKDNYLSLITFVKFSENVLFAFYLANFLIKENELNTDFLKHIIVGYSHVPHLLSDILKYIIKILFKEEQTELLKNIFYMIDTDNLSADRQILDLPYGVLTNIIGVEMRKNQKMREFLIPWYAQSNAGRKLYFERFFDMDCLVLHSGNDLYSYLQYNQSIEAKQYVCFMKFMQYFLSGDNEQCKIEYENSLKFQLPLGQGSFNAASYFIPKIVYHSVFEKKIDGNFIKEVLNLSSSLLQNGIQKKTGIPNFEFIIIFSLGYGKMNNEIIDLAHHIFKNYDLTNLKSSCFYQLFLSVYALALLELGKTKKAIELYDHVKFKNINIPEHMKCYVKIRLLFIKTEFLIFKGKLHKAEKKLQKIERISKMLKFSYFYNRAIDLGKSISTK